MVSTDSDRWRHELRHDSRKWVTDWITDWRMNEVREQWSLLGYSDTLAVLGVKNFSCFTETLDRMVKLWHLGHSKNHDWLIDWLIDWLTPMV